MVPVGDGNLGFVHTAEAAVPGLQESSCQNRQLSPPPPRVLLSISRTALSGSSSKATKS